LKVEAGFRTAIGASDTRGTIISESGHESKTRCGHVGIRDGRNTMACGDIAISSVPTHDRVYSTILCTGVPMGETSHESIYDFATSDRAMASVGRAFVVALERGLSQLGFQTVPEDSFGVIALRVVDRDHVGTAYVEFKDGTVQMRIVLLQDRGEVGVGSQSSSGDLETTTAA
jgi:hypothetical protein